MPQTWSNLRDNIANMLQDASYAIASTADIAYRMADGLRAIANIIPYLVRVPFTIESRTGVASTTSANNLVDTTEGQFTSGDVGKVVFNGTDKTWALITSYSSTSQVGLSKDIMTVNDIYYIFNKECTSEKQINVSEVTDYIGIPVIEYPIGTKRNINRVSSNPDIIALIVDTVGDSKALSSGVQPDTEVLIHFAKRHKVSQLTDLSATVAATCAAGATTLSVAGLQATGTIEADQEFTVANVRGTYWVKEDSTIAGNTAAVAIYPPIESAVASTATAVTFKLSSLTPRLEPVYCQYVAGKLAINDATTYYQQINTAVSTLAAATTAIANVAGKITAATGHIASGSVQVDAMTAQIASATTEIAKISAQVGAGTTALASGSALINTVPVAGGAPEYMAQADSDVNMAFGYLRNSQGYLSASQADGGVGSSFVQLATASLNAAGASLNEGIGNLRLVSSRLSVATAGRTLEAWGRQQVAEAERQLRAMRGVRKSTIYPTE